MYICGSKANISGLLFPCNYQLDLSDYESDSNPLAESVSALECLVVVVFQFS